VIEREIIERAVADLGEPPFRARQVYEALTRGLATDFAAMTALPRALRAELAARLRPVSLEEVETRVSRRGDARKTLFVTADGHPVESVLMTSSRRATVCVSSQVGCAVGCSFCASGRLGLQRDLTAVEIVDQALAAQRVLRPGGRQLTNVVFMGMGEPFANYDAVWKAVTILTDPGGLGLGARHLTISTVGLIPGIRRFTEENSQVRLAVSLHAPNDALRQRLVPASRGYPLADLMAALHDYVNKTGRRVTFEYTLISDVNDSPTQARELARLLEELTAHVNLIPLNAVEGSPLQPSSPHRVRQFQEALDSLGVPCTVRLGRGSDIQAACGQLRTTVPAL
jgi:23S rRNA (adenine2503-C2)-methyltransferase